MGQSLKSAPNGRIRTAQFYSVGQVAVLMGTAHSTVLRLIDQGLLSAFRMPTQRRDRRIAHNALITYVRKHYSFRYMLDKLDGYDPSVDFPEGLEPPPALAVPVRSAPPRSAHRPRSAKGGKVPRATTYSVSEASYLLGVSRRTLISKLEARVIIGIKVPTVGLTDWTWRVTHGCLARFLRENPTYSYAWNRIGCCELSGEDLRR
jgi:excisionase family DNA binding protein